MTGYNKQHVQSMLYEFVERSRDAYAIFDKQDRLIYCNEQYKDLMNIPENYSGALDFEAILRDNFAKGRGVRITDGDIDAFVLYAQTVRRSRAYRLFEVDFVDGRWFLFSEQLNDRDEMLVQIKEISKQKLLEQGLEHSISGLRKVALTDELTKVGNRRALVESINNELARCRRTGASMTMFLIDLDHFKKVNDRYGHQGGDEALRHVAREIKKSLRPYDILGRIGGEEFAVFLSNTKQKEGLEIAERTRITIEQSPAMFEDKSIHLSLSIGLTTCGCNTSFEELYQQADEALYQSKHQGRNRVTIYLPKDR